MRKGGAPDIPDILVIGAGIFGLSCAFACAERGLSVLVADRAHPGAGASGGPVGALSPHPPEKWDAKKQFQLATFLAAEAHWRAIATAGGVDPGYGRVGRLIPLTTPSQRARAVQHAANARALWPASAHWTVLPPGVSSLAPNAAPEGAVLETLSARLCPRQAIAARGAEIRGGCEALEVEPGAVRFAEGRIAAGAVILAAGMGGFGLMAPVLGRDPGQGVKGQALLLAPDRPFSAPMITADGLYIVPHADGAVAVGSTSENAWTDPTATDALLDALLARARALCPELTGARVVARWAGLRPRGPRPDPMLGPLPGRDRVFVANAGFRTGFGLAPAVGAALADMVTGIDPGLPKGFNLADHLDILRRRARYPPYAGDSD